MDLRSSELNGQQAEDRLPQIEITVNRNAVPSFDDGVAVKLRDRVSALADKFPLYPGLSS